MTLEQERAIVYGKAERLALHYSLRYGRVPKQVREILAATESLEALRKHNPYHDDLGRFTFAPGDLPGVFGLAPPDDKPLEPALAP